MLSEALSEYNELKGKEGDLKFLKGQANAVGKFRKVAGNREIDQYSRKDVRNLIRSMQEKGAKSATIKRTLAYISPIFSSAILEHELDAKNIFKSANIPNLAEDAAEKPSYTISELCRIADQCRQYDDDIRWLVAMSVNTGMRVAEVAGLRVDEIKLDSNVPHVVVQKNNIRRVKDSRKGSIRKIPLVGVSLWAASRVVSLGQHEAAFPKYTEEEFRPTTASGTTNKWIRSLGINKTHHSFRHTMRDRFREVNAPEEIQDYIGGWSRKSVGRTYGEGMKLETLMPWMQKIMLPTDN